jgi:hypothetical protein
MRSIVILALLLGLMVCRLGASAATAAPGQAAPPTDCRPAGSPGATDGQPAGPACRDASFSRRITQLRRGFWALEDAAPGAGRNAADPEPTVLRADPTPSPEGAGCTRHPLPVVVGGQPLLAMIVACPLADGGWEVTQYTPGLPPQVYEEPAYPEAAASEVEDYGYPGSYQDWADVPWFSGLAPVIVTGRKFQHFRKPFNHRFTDAVEHRSDRDFGHGLVHGFGRVGSVAGAPGSRR